MKEGEKNCTPKRYSCQGLIKLMKLTDKPTQQALALKYAEMGFPVFPCNSFKAPIVDHSLGFVHGFKDATKDLKLIVRTWHKYPDAGIGLKIPPDVIVFDCDVEKNRNGEPLIYRGKPVMLGLKSFETLVNKLQLSGIYQDTLITKTQSGGMHFYFLMPEGQTSFNHTHALEGLDLKGHGGYVILPNSQGQYGRYEFLNLTEIGPIPDALLSWSLKFKGSIGDFKPISNGSERIDRDAIVSALTWYWNEGEGRRNDLMLAIAGFIARSGGSEDDAFYVISKLCELTGKGYDHISGAKYAFHREGPVKGFSSLEKLMEEIANDRK